MFPEKMDICGSYNVSCSLIAIVVKWTTNWIESKVKLMEHVLNFTYPPNDPR